MKSLRRPSVPALLAIGLATAACSGDDTSRGQVMVVVSTDMVVPTDVNGLDWTVTLRGDPQPYASGSLTLDSELDLPATLAITSGPSTDEPVTIRIEGRKRGASDLLRVVREARVLVPDHRTAELPMRLTWLCSDGNLTEACDPGETCQAGACVDATVDVSQLADYEPHERTACLDAWACLQDHEVEVLPEPNLPEGTCTIRGSTQVGDANVNIALVVENTRVGNFGFCGPQAQCYIPLPRNDSREGWQVLRTGETPEVSLPMAVCEAVEKHTVKAIAILIPSSACPAALGDGSLCKPVDSCLRAGVCPSWGNAWVGYSCSGSATVSLEDPDVLACWTPPLDGDGSTSSNGRYCCTRGQEPASDELVIDDMSGGPQLKLAAPEGLTAGWWFTSLGQGSGSLEPSPSPGSLYAYRAFDPPVRPAGGPEIRAAACLRSNGFLSNVALQGFNFLQNLALRSVPTFDVSGYSGVSFWAWASDPFGDAPLGVRVHFQDANTRHGDRDADCWTPEDESKRCDSFHANRSFTSEWRQYFVPFNELHQSVDVWTPPQKRYEAFDSERAYTMTFEVEGAQPEVMSQPFDFCVADLRFTR